MSARIKRLRVRDYDIRLSAAKHHGVDFDFGFDFDFDFDDYGTDRHLDDKPNDRLSGFRVTRQRDQRSTHFRSKRKALDRGGRVCSTRFARGSVASSS